MRVSSISSNDYSNSKLINLMTEFDIIELAELMNNTHTSLNFDYLCKFHISLISNWFLGVSMLNMVWPEETTDLFTPLMRNRVDVCLHTDAL